MYIRSVTSAEVEQVKSDLKAMGIKASIKTTASVKRVQGSICITQRKVGDKWIFDLEEVTKIREYLLTNGFFGFNIEKPEYMDLCFRDGFLSIFKIA